jgi:hypothetical protein
MGALRAEIPQMTSLEQPYNFQKFRIATPETA